MSNCTSSDGGPSRCTTRKGRDYVKNVNKHSELLLDEYSASIVVKVIGHAIRACWIGYRR